MTERQINESNKRKAKYEYPIDLLVKGYTIDEIMLLLVSKNFKCSRNTLLRLKKEYVDNVARY